MFRFQLDISKGESIEGWTRTSVDIKPLRRVHLRPINTECQQKAELQSTTRAPYTNLYVFTIQPCNTNKYPPDVLSKCHVSTSHIVLRLLKDRTALLRWIGHSQYKTGLYALTLLCGGKLPFSILVRLLPQISARQLLEQCSRWSSAIKVWREHPEYSARLMQRRDCDAARNDKIHPQYSTHWVHCKGVWIAAAITWNLWICL